MPEGVQRDICVVAVTVSTVLFAILADARASSRCHRGYGSIRADNNRAAVGMLLSMTAYADVVVPGGGKSLVERVQQEARVPVFSHLMV